MRKILILVVSCLFILSCTIKEVQKKNDLSYKVSKGMSQKQVIDILGVPSSKSIKKKGDMFIYEYSHPSVTSTTWLCFGNNGKLSEMTLSGNSSSEFCIK